MEQEIMLHFRPSEARGHANFGWLDSRHTFSFGHYFDPQHISFGALRVINEDRVAPGAGFGTHGHENMEIISYVLDGALEHKDSLGNGSVIRPGDVQRMTAGTGVRHSEYNHSSTDPVHFLQIWIVPEREGLEPGYEEKSFATTERDGNLRLIGSRDGRNGSLTIHQDVDLYNALMTQGDEISFDVRTGRKVWIQSVRGGVSVNGQPLDAGDGLGIVSAGELEIAARGDAEFLLFDIAA